MEARRMTTWRDDLAGDLRDVKKALDDLVYEIVLAEEDALAEDCDRVAKAMHALKGAVLGFRDDVLGIIDG